MDYNTLFRPIAESFAEHRPDGGTPFEVTCTETGRRLYVHVYLAWHVNDIRGVPSVTCSAHPPCYVGNCTLCKVKGVRRLNRIIVPGAVCYLPPTDALRKEYAQEFKNDQDLRALASSVRPLKRQKAEVAASAGRIARRQSNKADEAFYNVPVFQELLPYFDVTKCTIYDRPTILPTPSSCTSGVCATMAAEGTPSSLTRCEMRRWLYAAGSPI